MVRIQSGDRNYAPICVGLVVCVNAKKKKVTEVCFGSQHFEQHRFGGLVCADFVNNAVGVEILFRQVSAESSVNALADIHDVIIKKLSLHCRVTNGWSKCC